MFWEIYMYGSNKNLFDSRGFQFDSLRFIAAKPMPLIAAKQAFSQEFALGVS
jgi:hypothetical protein